VTTLEPLRSAGGAITAWRAALSGGGSLLARRVVVGIGSTNIPRLPDFLPPEMAGQCMSFPRGRTAPAAAPGAPPPGRVAHAWQLVEAACAEGARRPEAACGARGAPGRKAGRGSTCGSGSSSSSSSERAMSVSECGSPRSSVGCGSCESREAASDCGGEDGGGGGGRLTHAQVTAASPLAAAGLVGPGEHVIIVGGDLGLRGWVFSRRGAVWVVSHATESERGATLWLLRVVRMLWPAGRSKRP
jgi:hypothetical protein